jgi:hypothetical protein
MIEAVLKSGLLSKDALEEMKRFSPVIPGDAVVEELKDLDTAVTIIATALESEGYVVVRETDLEVFHQYVETSKPGTLHIETDESQTDIEITYGKTKMGEYIIAWRSESIEDLLTNGRSYLQAEGNRIFFSGLRELFFGETKAFMVAQASAREAIPTTDNAA